MGRGPEDELASLAAHNSELRGRVASLLHALSASCGAVERAEWEVRCGVHDEEAAARRAASGAVRASSGRRTPPRGAAPPLPDAGASLSARPRSGSCPPPRLRRLSEPAPLSCPLMPREQLEDAVASPVMDELHRAPRPDSDYGTCQYDPGSSAVYHEYLRALDGRGASHRVHLTVFRWVLALLIGAGTAGVAFFIDYFCLVLYRAKFERVLAAIEDCGGCLSRPFGVYVGVNFLFTAVAAVTVCVAPVAAGSGIPEIKCYLNGVKIPGVLHPKTLVAKATGVLFSVAAGLPCGKEGPMIHSGAVVAAGLARGPPRFACLRRVTVWWDYLRSDKEKRDFVSCGAAAGVAAAFGAPVGGLLFAIEEGCSYWTPELIWRIFFSSIVSAFTMAFLSARETRERALNAPGMIDFGDFSSHTEETPWITHEVPVFILVGAFGGLLGALFIKANMVVTRWRHRATMRIDAAMPQFLRAGEDQPAATGLGWRICRIFEALIMSFLVSSAAFLTFALPQACQPDPTAAPADDTETTTWRHVWCPHPEQHSDWATLWLNPATSTLKTLFHTEAHIHPAVLFGFFSLYLGLMVLNYGVGVPSGLFVPSLVSGAVFGRMMACC